jgi:hypothetical protein
MKTTGMKRGATDRRNPTIMPGLAAMELEFAVPAFRSRRCRFRRKGHNAWNSNSKASSTRSLTLELSPVDARQLEIALFWSSHALDIASDELSNRTSAAARSSSARCQSRADRFDAVYLRDAQAYMLISMPTGTSTIFGVFHVIWVSQVVLARRRTKLNLEPPRTQRKCGTSKPSTYAPRYFSPGQSHFSSGQSSVLPMRDGVTASHECDAVTCRFQLSYCRLWRGDRWPQVPGGRVNRTTT